MDLFRTLEGREIEYVEVGDPDGPAGGGLTARIRQLTSHDPSQLRMSRTNPS
jgi:hypothetical protein